MYFHFNPNLKEDNISFKCAKRIKNIMKFEKTHFRLLKHGFFDILKLFENDCCILNLLKKLDYQNILL